MDGDRRFPVLKQETKSEMPRSVPWEFAETFRAQAESNHGQTLERLKERGGLCPEEIWLAAHGQPWRERVDEATAIAWLNDALAKWAIERGDHIGAAKKGGG